MIDLHTHILSGLDDGPRDLAGAVAIARAAAEAGVRVLVATPHAFGSHMNVAPAERDTALGVLRAELGRLGIRLQLAPGFECRVVEALPEILAAEPEYLYPRLGGTSAASGGRYVLMELAEDMPVTCADTMLFRLQRLGIVPILAHPERHPEVRRGVEVMEGFVRRGGKLQITASGLLGEAGWRERRVCEKLLRQGLVAVLASDAHTVEEAGCLAEALARATRLIGPAARELVTSNPAAILGASDGALGM